MVAFSKHILLIILFPVVIFAQSNNNIELKNNELANIKSRIIELEKDLKDKQVSEAEEVKILDKINHQTHLLNKIIKEIGIEEKKIENRISKIATKVENIKSEVVDLKREYSDFVKWLYVNSKESKWNFLPK